MNLNVKQKKIISLVMVSILFVMELVGTICTFINNVGLDANPLNMHYYTQDSNYLNMIVCAIAIPFIVKSVKDENYVMPKFVRILRFITTTCLFLTFVVVVLVLGPVDGTGTGWVSKLFGPTIEGTYKLQWPSNLFFHLLCPLFSIASFLFFEESPRLKFVETLYGIIPTVAYALIMGVLALVFKWGNGTEGIRFPEKAPYFFLNVYSQSVLMSILYLIAIPALSYGLACALRAFDNLTNHAKIETESVKK